MLKLLFAMMRALHYVMRIVLGLSVGLTLGAILAAALPVATMAGDDAARAAHTVPDPAGAGSRGR